MKTRIPINIKEGRLLLIAVIESKQLRIPRQAMSFVIDTGSPDSYLSHPDVLQLQIPISGKPSKGIVDFGGSRYQQIELPKINLYLLKEDSARNDFHLCSVNFSALRATKRSVINRVRAASLPSILGLDFLRSSKCSLHVVLTEDLAYLEYEG